MLCDLFLPLSASHTKTFVILQPICLLYSRVIRGGLCTSENMAQREKKFSYSLEIVLMRVDGLSYEFVLLLVGDSCVECLHEFPRFHCRMPDSIRSSQSECSQSSGLIRRIFCRTVKSKKLISICNKAPVYKHFHHYE